MRRFSLVVLLALGVVVSGCGGDSPDPAPKDSNQTPDSAYKDKFSGDLSTLVDKYQEQNMTDMSIRVLIKLENDTTESEFETEMSKVEQRSEQVHHGFPRSNLISATVKIEKLSAVAKLGSVTKIAPEPTGEAQ